MQHMALEVSDMRAFRDTAQERGGFTDLQVRAHVGHNRHWLVHLVDPDGSRTEVMETAVQDALQPMTVMAPGKTVAPPIAPTTPGEIPWPSAQKPPGAATLKGWDGPTDLWRVENGLIAVRSKAEPPTGPTYPVVAWRRAEGFRIQVGSEARRRWRQLRRPVQGSPPR